MVKYLAAWGKEAFLVGWPLLVALVLSCGGVQMIFVIVFMGRDPVVHIPLYILAFVILAAVIFAFAITHQDVAFLHPRTHIPGDETT